MCASEEPWLHEMYCRLDLGHSFPDTITRLYVDDMLSSSRRHLNMPRTPLHRVQSDLLV